MEKRTKIIAACAIVVCGGIGCYKTMPHDSESSLFIENVEALSATAEMDAGKKLTCYSSWTGEGKGDTKVYKCNPCGTEVTCVSAGDKSSCK